MNSVDICKVYREMLPRWVRFADRLLFVARRGAVEPSDIVSEAVLCVLSGRKQPETNSEFTQFVYVQIRSLIINLASKPQAITLEYDIADYNDDVVMPEDKYLVLRDKTSSVRSDVYLTPELLEARLSPTLLASKKDNRGAYMTSCRVLVKNGKSSAIEFRYVIVERKTGRPLYQTTNKGKAISALYSYMNYPPRNT